MGYRVRATVAKGVLLLTGLLLSHSAASVGQQFEPPSYDDDVRLLILKNFFEERRAPASSLAEEFLIAADRHNLDWRLLPSICFVETGGGKAANNNNLFGWDSGQAEFASMRDSIHHVAARLTHSELYRDKQLDEKLSLYNPFPRYGPLVKSVMNRLSPSRLPPGAAGTQATHSSIWTPK